MITHGIGSLKPKKNLQSRLYQASEKKSEVAQSNVARLNESME